MDLLKDLPIKYLTGTYKVIYDSSNVRDVVMMLVDTIKNMHKSKKNWNQHDFVLSQDRFDSIDITEEAKQRMFDNLFLTKDDNGTIKLTDKSLKLIFEI